MPTLFLTLLRLILIALPVMLVLVYVFNLGMYGVWIGLVTASITSMFVAFFWVCRTINRLESGKMAIW